MKLPFSRTDNRDSLDILEAGIPESSLEIYMERIKNETYTSPTQQTLLDTFATTYLLEELAEQVGEGRENLELYNQLTNPGFFDRDSYADKKAKMAKLSDHQDLDTLSILERNEIFMQRIDLAVQENLNFQIKLTPEFFQHFVIKLQIANAQISRVAPKLKETKRQNLHKSKLGKAIKAVFGQQVGTMTLDSSVNNERVGIELDHENIKAIIEHVRLRGSLSLAQIREVTYSLRSALRTVDVQRQDIFNIEALTKRKLRLPVTRQETLDLIQASFENTQG